MIGFLCHPSYLIGILYPFSEKIIPLENYGVKCMSMGFLTPPGSPVAWRGLMVRVVCPGHFLSAGSLHLHAALSLCL